MRGGAQEHGHVAVSERALGGELLDSPGQEPGLRSPPRGDPSHGGPERQPVGRESVVPPSLLAVGDQQLNARAQRLRRLARVLALPQRLEVRAPELAEDQVDGVQHLAAAAEVHGDSLQPAGRSRLVAAALELGHVGVPEAVDRLALVAHHEHVVAAEEPDQVALQRAGVLELVDHHGLEAPGVVVAQPGIARQEVARQQLQVVEVQARALALELVVVAPVEQDQLRQQAVGAVLLHAHAQLVVGLAGLTVRLARRPLERVHVPGDGQVARLRGLGKVTGGQPFHQGLAAREPVAGLLDVGPARVADLHQRGGERGREGLSLAGRRGLDGVGHARLPAAPAALVGVGGAHHVRQPLGPVARQQPQPLGILAAADELGQSAIEGVDAEPIGLQGVEHAKVRVHPCREGVRAQQAPAEAVDRGDPRRLGVARQVQGVEVLKPRADPLGQLGGRLLGERDRQDRVHRHAVVHHGAHEALDQHGGLAGARAGTDQEVAVPALDRAQLLVGEGGHHSTLQMDGYEQPPR